tara:strand:+ start:694 stop:1665 length:972 start_codon:yes stop_codon:yes gene_type:complete
MNITNYVLTFIALTTVGILYDKYSKKYDLNNEERDVNLIKKYLLNENNVLVEDKPILWIHSSTEVNSRNWKNFKSRNNNNLNQTYLVLCIETAIKHCSESFNVCLINDDSFEKLLPKWNINLNGLSDPIKSHVRTLGILKLMYNYGGMLIPNSMIVLKDLNELRSELLVSNKLLAGEFLTRNNISSKSQFFPSHKLLCCNKNNDIILNLINKMQVLISKDNTADMDFTGELDREIYKECIRGNVQLIDGKALGVKTNDNEVILIDDLVGNSYLDINSDFHGLYIASDELLKRTKLNWFVRLERSEILRSNTNIGKYLLLSLGK